MTDWLTELDAEARRAREADPDLVKQRKAQILADRAARAELDAGGAAEMPEVTSGDMLLSEQDVDVPWRVDRLMPAGGNVLVTARAKTGKTSLIGNVVKALCDGGQLLGKYEVTPPDGTVVVLDTEMTRAAARRWYADLGIRRSDRLWYVGLRGKTSAFDILTPSGRGRWADAVAPYTGDCATVAILDPLAPVLGALGLDENSNADIMRLLAAWDEWCRESGIRESVIVHHAGHGSERARGASRLLDWPDVIWNLTRQDDDPDSPRFLNAYGRDVAEPEQRLEFDPATRLLTVAAGTRRQARADEVRAAVTGALTRAGVMNGSQLEAELAPQHGRDPVRAALAQAVADGEVTMTPGPRRAKLYSLTPRVRGSSRPASSRTRECVRGPIEGRELADSPEGSGEDISPRSQAAGFQGPCPDCRGIVRDGADHDCRTHH